ncbi:MAG TPA: RICIN domain-containing protein [Candidatus Angelobacter sp.]|nr:RICIN domain-containing protein [Candidatus Angelobacter sp.]
MKYTRSKLGAAAVLTAAALVTNAWAYQGSTTPKLHVSGRFLQDTSNKSVVLHGYMQPTASFFNGNMYSDPTDWTSPSNVAGMLNYLESAAAVMSDTTPKYGQSHGWYSTFVRVNTDSIGGWTSQNGLVDANQFNGWIQNFVVPFASYLSSRGMYLVLSATGPINTPNDGNNNCSVAIQQRLITFWQTVANASGVKSANNIMFELMNEPVNIESSPGNGDWGNHQAKYFQAMQAWIQPIINAIRNTGADNVIWVPSLEFEGSPYEWAQYPFSGANTAIACHYYPAYGGVHDNQTSVQNLWNSEYKPAADVWPMIITECYWFQEPNNPTDLDAGSTAGFGNALKNAMDAEGNVSYIVGFLSDLLANISSGPPSSLNLSTNDGAQAYFRWQGGYVGAAPTGSSGIVGNGTYKIIARHSGKALDATGNGTANGTQIEQWTYNGGNNQRWTVTAVGGGEYSIIGVQSGRCVDINAAGTANGTKVQLWDYLGGANQKYFLCPTTSGYYRIQPAHLNAAGSCLDVNGASTADGALVQLWQWLDGNNQQWSFQAP